MIIQTELPEYSVRTAQPSTDLSLKTKGIWCPRKTQSKIITKISITTILKSAWFLHLRFATRMMKRNARSKIRESAKVAREQWDFQDSNANATTRSVDCTACQKTTLATTTSKEKRRLSFRFFYPKLEVKRCKKSETQAKTQSGCYPPLN